MDNMDEKCDRFVHHPNDSAYRAERLKSASRHLFRETLEQIRHRGVRTSPSYHLTLELVKLYRGAAQEHKKRAASALVEAAEMDVSTRNARRNFIEFMTALRRLHGKWHFIHKGNA